MEIVAAHLTEALEHRALMVVAANRLDFAIAEEVGDVAELLGARKRLLVVTPKIIAIRAVECIDIPMLRVKSLLYYLERLLVARRYQRAAGLALVKELVLRHLGGFALMCNKDDLHLIITRADELVEQKEEASGQILLQAVHRARRVHDADDDRVAFLARLVDQTAVSQILLAKRKAGLAFIMFGQIGLVLTINEWQALSDPPPNLRLDGTFAIEMHTNAGLAVTLALTRPLSEGLLEDLPLHIGEFQILEHDVDQLVDRDLRLVDILTRMIAGRPLTLLALSGRADDIPNFCIPIANTDTA